MTQYFFPRLGFSLDFLARWASPQNPLEDVSKKELFPEYLNDYSPMVQVTDRGPEFFLDFGNGPIFLGLKSRNSVSSAILNDGKWYKKYLAGGEAVSTKKFLDPLKNKKGVPSSADLLAMAAKLHILPDLEFELSRGVKQGRRKNEGLLELVDHALKAKAQISDGLLDFWLLPLSRYGEQASCDCGSDYCFFDIVKKMQLKYFPDTYDKPEAVKDFWKKLSPAQKAILIFMHEAVGVTPLVAQAMFEENCDMAYLSELICQGNQPDSPHVLQVRRYMALVDYFWRRQKGR
jgi:hypothetical protein